MPSIKEPETTSAAAAADERFDEQRREILGVLLIGVGLLTFVAIFWDGAGFIGEILKRAFYYLFGQRGAVIPAIFLVVVGWSFLSHQSQAKPAKDYLALIMLFIWALLILHLFSGVAISDQSWDRASEGGGVIGHFIVLNLMTWFGKIGLFILMFIWLIISAILAVNRPLIKVFATIFAKRALEPTTTEPVFDSEAEEKVKQIPAALLETASFAEKKSADRDLSQGTPANVIPFPPKEVKPPSTILTSLQNMMKEKDKAKDKEKGKVKEEPKPAAHPSGTLYKTLPPGSYQLPDLNLVGTGGATIKKNLRYNDQSHKLEETLAHFGIQAKVIEVHHGPVITRYELQPAPGVKVSRIVNLIDDIALALAAKGLRLEAPIPGKAAIGVEVPNQETQIVTFREVLDAKSFWNSGKLSVALGVDISGEVVVADLRKMPHLLVAGATGSGKSVCVNTLIMSILYKALPSEVKFIMIDPKMVELSMYNGIPHLMAPVVTEAKKASGVLKLVVTEMENRYKLFAEARVRDLDKYNETLPDGEKLPWIVVIIDELADLMMVAPVEVEDSICRLAQMARATGIHLVVATQRPSVDVITGLIKANIPSRIAFAVSSQVDSRTILDSVGAERLLGRGDMLFNPVGAMKPLRVQGALVVEKEIEAVIKHWKEQGQPKYQEQYINVPDEKEISLKQEDDDLFWDAVKVIVEYGQASASVLQRRLRVGYTRAARLVDMMESRGIVGPYEGSKPREVYITARQMEELRKKEQS